VQAQDAAAPSLPASMPRFATHLELHRSLMLARAGDRAGGTAYARAAMGALPPEKHSLTLRMLVAEIERAPGPTVRPPWSSWPACPATRTLPNSSGQCSATL